MVSKNSVNFDKKYKWQIAKTYRVENTLDRKFKY